MFNSSSLLNIYYQVYPKVDYDEQVSLFI